MKEVAGDQWAGLSPAGADGRQVDEHRPDRTFRASRMRRPGRSWRLAAS